MLTLFVALLWVACLTLCVVFSHSDTEAPGALSDHDSSSDTEADAANNQEGRRKRPCRCGACITAMKRDRHKD